MRDPTTSFCIRVLGGQSVEMLIAKHQYVADSYCHLPAEKILSYLGNILYISLSVPTHIMMHKILES